MVEIIEKEQFSVVGKLGKGFANEAPQWIPSLAIHRHVQTVPVCFVKESMCT
ncbi:hypothetical protein [Brevibacillus choshinensis]|uniref:Uncharacterized protein n=1 Tax=Brevibacillus choshinensis TaxID=54911 RepID=A0ABX7FIX4_BRECH|nr:hypothetical protein [Brevibacillus choshinensis]QRG65227.1 hypothetical protein JNE38_16415 [Brevibacillus choshinensis]